VYNFVSFSPKLYTRKGKGNKIIHKKGKRKQHYTQEREKETKLYTRKGKENKIIHKKGKRKQNYTQEREKETKLYTRKGKGPVLVYKVVSFSLSCV
jgi:K+/H+ antiporter YhaU regulatory subunit KhtT